MTESTTPAIHCKTCVFWDARPRWPDSIECDEVVGLCLRHAPRIVTIAPIEIDRVSDEPHTLRPLDVIAASAVPAQTWASEWCGEWRGEWPRPEGQQRVEGSAR